MKQTVNYRQLRTISNDINSFSIQSPGLAILLKEKIANFYKRNAIRINTLNQKMNQFAKDHVKHDDKGNAVTETNEKGILVFVFETEEKKKLYLEETNKFLTEVTFEIEV